MTGQEVKKLQVLGLVKTCSSIDRADVKKTVAIQDLLNVTGDLAHEIMGELDREGRRRLLWIISAACGYDTFEFWWQYGLAPRLVEKIEAQFAEADEEHAKKMRDIWEKEAALELKESAIDRKIERAEKERGTVVTWLRRRLANLQDQLEAEQAKNRKVKALLRAIK